MDEIIGFSKQIKARKATRPAIKQARPATRPAMQPTRPATRPAMQPARPATMPATRQATRPAMQPARPTTRPAQIKLKPIARPTTRPAMQARPATKKVMPKQAIIKPSGQIIPVRTLTRITNPTLVKKATPIQRSFMPVDLPYQTIAPKTKPMLLPATNYKLTTSIDLVEPPVDAGISNYYGK